MYPFNYKYALYRRNNFNQVCVWYAKIFSTASIIIYHGILGKNITKDIIFSSSPFNEVTSKTISKRKVGYKLLSEVKDNVEPPVEEELLSYLDKYLPVNRTTIDGSLLPMLAKVYDNTNNKLFNKVSSFIGQWKINGLRCFVSAEVNTCDMFKPVKLKFQSREGTYWNSLIDLEEYLLSTINNKLLDKMIEEHYILDGEIYLPGHTINEINHFVKDPNCAENKLLQYWCYDIAIEDTIQYKRIEFLLQNQPNNVAINITKETHLDNKEKFIILPIWHVTNDDEAIKSRNKSIELGFEGLIMRNPNAEYQYGKRNLSMIKFKKSTDGKFTIIDIYPEGIKRKNIPLFLLKNDINNSTFEVHVGGNQNYQAQILQNKNNYIGKEMYVEYGERSGVNKVPFHIKKTMIL